MSRRKTTVQLTPEADQIIRELRADGATVSEVVRRALILENYITKAIARGAKISVTEPDGTLRELIIR